MRTIQVDHQDLDSVEEAKTEIKRQIQSLEESSSSLESPISVALEGSIDEIKTRDQGHLEEKINKIEDNTEEILRRMDAEKVADDPEEAKQAVVNIRVNPTASLIHKAIAQAIFFQQQGKRKEAIEKWRAVAHVAEESDNEFAARAWFSVGYLLGNSKDSISAYDRAISLKPDYADAYYDRGVAKGELGHYEDAIANFDEAIRLKPDYADAYYDRGVAKGELGQHEDAIADFDEAIRLKPDYAEAYIHKGVAKGELDLIDEARQDFGNARDLAREAGNDSLANLAEQRLRGLDADDT